MSITYVRGDIIKSVVADWKVNTVNCVGVMGKGVALAFKLAFPVLFQNYRHMCSLGHIKPGSIHAYRSPEINCINFATKNHWRDPSKLEWVESGLQQLEVWISEELKRTGKSFTIAIPPLGCGNGGLNWSDVEPLIIATHDRLKGRVDFIICRS